MKEYSGDRAAAREFLQKILFDAIRSGRYGRDCMRDIHVAANRAENIHTERARRAKNEQARRDRLKAERLPAPRAIDPSRLRRDAKALKLWLRQDGRPQRKLRLRAKEIMLARACLATYLATAGRYPKHREVAEWMTRRTGEPWTVRQGQTALAWIEAIEATGTWRPLNVPKNEDHRPEGWGTF